MVTGRAAAQETAPAADETATIHGVVLSTADSMPIAGAAVKLGFDQGAIVTDEQGRFELKAVPFGTSILSARKPGYLCGGLVRAEPKPECVKSVNVFEKSVGVTLTMLPQAVVTGRIVDQDGNPVNALHVQLVRREFENSKYAYKVVGQAQKDTDEQGRFRLEGLEPGAYLLGTSSIVDPADRRVNADRGYAATYYPGTQARAEAKPIVLRAGDDFTADMTVKSERFQEVTVAFAWDKPWNTGSIGTGLTGDSLRDGLYAAWDDEHRVIKLYAPAGDYNLQFAIHPPADPKTGEEVPWPDGSTLPFFGSVAFTAKDQPLHLTGIPSEQPVTIRLHVRAELTEQEKWKANATPARPYKDPAVTFELTGGEDGLNHQVSWRNGQGPSDLEFKDILAGSYVTMGDTLCCNAAAYIASLTCGSADLEREPLVIGPGKPVCAIEAVIRDDVAQIAIGLTPKAESQLKAAGIDVTDAALIPLDEELEPPYSAAVWRGSDPKMNMIRPGKYLAFLFDGRQLAWRDPDEAKRLMSLGTVVTIAPGESKTIQLDWLPELNDPHKQPMGVALGQVLP